MAGLFGSEVTVSFLGLLYFVHYFNIQKLFVIFFFYILFFHIRQKKKKIFVKVYVSIHVLQHHHDNER